MTNSKKLLLKLYVLDDIIKIEDSNFDNILIDEKLYENILFFLAFHTKV